MKRWTGRTAAADLADRRISIRLDRYALVVLVFGAGLGVGALNSRAGAESPVSAQPISAEQAVANVASGLTAPPKYVNAVSDAERRRALVETLQTQGASGTWNAYVAPAVATAGDRALALADHPTEAQLEVLRGQMEGFLVDLHAAVELVPEERRLDLLDKIEEATDGIGDLTTEQLNEAHDALRPYPGFWSIPAYARSVLEQNARENALRAAAPGTVTLPPGGPVLPGLPQLLPDRVPTVPSQLPQAYENCKLDKVTCEGCPPPVAGGEATLFALQTAAWAAESVCSYFDGDITIFGAQIPNWAKIICVVAYSAIQATADAVTLAHEISQECENDYHAHLINAYLDETVSSRASQQSHNFHRLWELRLEIENAMLDEGNLRVSLFQLPASQGGYLDSKDDVSVRYIVADTIATLSAAGYDVRNAQTEYNTAEVHLAAGRFKDAFARYRLAYRAAVSVGREP